MRLVSGRAPERRGRLREVLGGRWRFGLVQDGYELGGERGSGEKERGRFYIGGGVILPIRLRSGRGKRECAKRERGKKILMCRHFHVLLHFVNSKRKTAGKPWIYWEGVWTQEKTRSLGES